MPVEKFMVGAQEYVRLLDQNGVVLCVGVEELPHGTRASAGILYVEDEGGNVERILTDQRVAHELSPDTVLVGADDD